MQRLARATRTFGRYFSTAAAVDVSALTSGARPRLFGPPEPSALRTEYWAPDVETQLKYWVEDFVQAEEDWLLSDARKDVAQFKAFMAAYYTPAAMLVRPSGCPGGNPITQAGWIEMMSKEDVKLTSKKLLSISHITTFGGVSPPGFGGELHTRTCNGAVVVFTTHEKFTYNGNALDDIASWSVTLSKHGTHGGYGELRLRWMLEHLHRSSGSPVA
jgi:hypothetical protein